MSLVDPHLFLMSCLADFYLILYLFLFFSRAAFSIPPLFSLLIPCLTLFPVSFLLSFRPPHLGLDFVLALDLDLVSFFGLYPFLLPQGQTSVNTVFCYPSVRLSFVLW